MAGMGQGAGAEAGRAGWGKAGFGRGVGGSGRDGKGVGWEKKRIYRNVKVLGGGRKG
jgi:hypothetical protein